MFRHNDPSSQHLCCNAFGFAQYRTELALQIAWTGTKLLGFVLKSTAQR
jgi:hypothetical protein